MTHDPALLRWQVFYLPKKGHTGDEYEDAWAADPARGRFALADGASETSFAGRWAQLLTEDFLAAAKPSALPEWIAGSRRRWASEVMGLELPWYAEMKREQGAFATLLGLGVRPPEPDRAGKWRAVAVGDSCLIQVRNGGCVETFPLKKASDFGNLPRLIGSRGALPPTAEGCSGSFLTGDCLFLMTDALAQWFLQMQEGGGRPWEAVAPLLSAAQPDDAFADWIEALRQSDGLRNDDVTLLTIEPGSSPRE
jgi:hypothetical protein